MSVGTRNEFLVNNGKAAEFEERMRARYELFKTLPGFERGSLNNSLGYPQRYTTVDRWETREAALASRRNPEYNAYLAKYPMQSLGAPSRPMEVYEIVHTVRDEQAMASAAGSGTRSVSNLVEWTIDSRPGNVKAFEDRTLELFELRKRYGHGMLTQVCHRFLGGGGRYLQLVVYRSLEDLRATAAVPEVARFMEAHPFTMYASAPPVLNPCEGVFAAARVPVA